MEKRLITMESVIDAGTFRDFALFDNLHLRRRWRAPAVFAAILLAFAFVCMMLRARAEQAVLLGSVLAAVGLGLPAIYFLSFLRSIRLQSRKLQLDHPRPAYTLCLSAAGGLKATTKRESASYRWEDLFGAYRHKGCIYLYVSSRKAYLLPESQIPGGAEALWQLLLDKMPSDRVSVCGRKRTVPFKNFCRMYKKSRENSTFFLLVL